MLSKHRSPTHPGEILLEEFLKPLKISQTELAKKIKVPFQRINELVKGKRGITPSTAIRLSKYFGSSPQFWMNAQQELNLYLSKKSEGKIVDTINQYTKIQPDSSIPVQM